MSTAPATAPTQWPAEALWEQLHPRLDGFTVEVLAQVNSTNDELMRRARRGDTAPTLLVAEQQTAGRGRRGRTWHSAPGQSLTASLGLALAPRDWSGLSLAVGVALAEALHPDICLKWPNDLWLGGAKLGGILVETATLAAGSGHTSGFAASPEAAGSVPRYAVIGFGLNIAPPPADALAAPVGGPAPQAVTGLQALGPDWTAPVALAAVVPALVDALQRFQASGFAAFAQRFEARDALAGQRISIWGTGDTPQWLREGLCLGVGADGALRLRDDSGREHAEHHGEVSVRPATGVATGSRP